MINERIKLMLAIVVVSLITSIYFSISTTLIIILLGLLVIPPFLILLSLVIEGTLINKKLKRISDPDREKPILVISK